MLYVLSAYPTLSEYFYHLEIQGLRSTGLRVQVLSLRSGDPDLRAEWGVVPADVLEVPLSCVSVWLAAFRELSGRAQDAVGIFGEAIRALWRRPLELLRVTVAIIKTAAVARRVRQGEVGVVHGAWCSLPGVAAWALWRLCSGVRLTVACNAYDYDGRHPMLPRILVDSDLVFTHCRARQRQIGAEWPNTARSIACVYRGADTASLDPDVEPVRSGVLFVGSLAPYKGVEVLIDAVAELRDRGRQVTLTVVGEPKSTTKDYFRMLRAGVAAKGLQDAVEWRGGQPHDVVMEEMRRAEVFALPSLWCDVLPNVVKEAMACATPVVVTDTLGIEELVPHRRGGLVVPMGSVNAMADALQEVLERPDWAREMARKGRQHVREHFDIAVTTEQRRQLFSAVLAEPRSS